MKRQRTNFLVAGFLAIIFILTFGIFFVSQRKRSFKMLSAISFSMLLILVLALYLFLPKVVTAYEVQANPSVFEGPIGVVGEVTIGDDGNMLFIIEKCKNRKMVVPIKYTGDKYMTGTKVIAYGKLEWNKMGEYCFCADNIIASNNDLTGRLIHFARKIFERPRKWIYKHCPTCDEWKNSLFSTG